MLVVITFNKLFRTCLPSQLFDNRSSDSHCHLFRTYQSVQMIQLKLAQSWCKNNCVVKKNNMTRVFCQLNLITIIMFNERLHVHKHSSFTIVNANSNTTCKMTLSVNSCSNISRSHTVPSQQSFVQSLHKEQCCSELKNLSCWSHHFVNTHHLCIYNSVNNTSVVRVKKKYKDCRITM